MILLEKFKSYLAANKNKPSNITIKNYFSDIRKFIGWLEGQSRTSFNPRKITSETINVYKAYLTEKGTPARSMERYLSSLRKLFNYLQKENLMTDNPFAQEINSKQLPQDPLLLDQFKIYLLNDNISKITIKNYLLDIKHFFGWLDVALGTHDQNIYKDINVSLIEEYKSRLLKDAHISPVSLNRKLSSLRKYMNWVGKKNINVKNITCPNIKKTLQSFKEIKNEGESVAPFSIKLIDIIISIPIVRTLEAISLLIWKIKGANAFTPIQKTPAKPSKLLTIFSISKNIKKDHIHNIPKSIYAPLKISVNSLPRHKKIYFHILYTRPKWYDIYHSYPVVHYFHTAILLIFTTTVGSVIYNDFYGMPQQKTVYASPPRIQPKILAFQGKLKDSYNNPIITATPLRFAIYNNQSASGSALLWQEIQTIDPDEQGSFKTQIGKKNPISSSLFSDNRELYLGMTVGNDNELQPRQEISTASYSNNSEQLQGMIPITENGAGTSNVILALDSAGNLNIGGKATPTFEANGGQFTLSGKTLLLTSAAGSDGNIIIAPDGNGMIDLNKPLQNTSSNNTGSFQGAVEIDDLLAIIATSSGQSAFTINQNSSGPLISASTSGIAMFTLENNGTGIFAGNLAINGDSLASTNTSFNLLNNNTINLNIGNTATAISLGSNMGNTIINNTLITRSAYIDNLHTSQITATQGADLAENYISSQSLEPGDVIMPEGKNNNLAVIKTTNPYESGTIGIVSTKPGITLNSEATTDNTHPYTFPIALSGRIPVKVTTENGFIKAGDYLTTSAIPGVSMKATGKGTAIGKALEDYSNPNPNTIGKILVFANLSFYNPSTTGYFGRYNLQDNINSILSSIQAGFLQAQEIVADSLHITTENITIGGQTLKEYIAEIIQETVRQQIKKELADQSSVISHQSSATDILSPLASESAMPSVLPEISSATDSAQQFNNLTMKQLNNDSASSSSAVASDAATYITNITNIYNTPTASNSVLPSDLSAATLAKEGASSVIIASNSAEQSITQLTTLSDVAIIGSLNIGGNFILSNNAINTLGSDLQLQPLRQGNLSIMGDLLVIDTDGNLKINGNAVFAKNVTVKGKMTTNIIAPIPDSDLVIQLGNNQDNSASQSAIRNPQFAINNASGSAVLTVNQQGDIRASGSGTFSTVASNSFNIIRGAQADTSLVQTIASSSAGIAVIKVNETERTIISPFVTKDSLIYLTAASDTEGLTPYIARQTEKDFTVAIPYAINKDIKINWWIIN